MVWRHTQRCTARTLAALGTQLLQLSMPDMPCLAGDVNRIKIGSNTTILDNVVIHVAQHNPQETSAPTIIGDNVTIGPAQLCMQACAREVAQCLIKLLCWQGMAPPSMQPP